MFGSVDDVEIDEETWRATRIVVRVRSDAGTDLGLEKPPVLWRRARLPIPVHQIAGTSGTIVLRSTLEEIAQLVAIAEAERDDIERE